jgi:trans-aconitate methyltransferase
MIQIIKTLAILPLEIFSIVFLGKLSKEKDFKRTIELYSKSDKFTSVFVKLRLWDAPFTEISKLIPSKCKVLDLGCGDGILINFLAQLYPKAQFTGIEINKTRLKEADKKLPNTSFKRGNVLTYAFPKSDIILMTHLLHHLPSLESQVKLIKKAQRNLNKNGKLIITEIDTKPTAKYVITYLVDAFIVPIFFEKKMYDFNFHYRTKTQWKNLLAEEGLKVKSFPAHKDKPFSHIIFNANK